MSADRGQVWKRGQRVRFFWGGRYYDEGRISRVLTCPDTADTLLEVFRGPWQVPALINADDGSTRVTVIRGGPDAPQSVT